MWIRYYDYHCSKIRESTTVNAVVVVLIPTTEYVYSNILSEVATLYTKYPPATAYSSTAATARDACTEQHNSTLYDLCRHSALRKYDEGPRGSLAPGHVWVTEIIDITEWIGYGLMAIIKI